MKVPSYISPSTENVLFAARNLKYRIFRAMVFGAAISTLVFAVFLPAGNVGRAQTTTTLKTGERLTYNISFGNLDSAGFAETRVVSKGKLEGRDAVELFGKLTSFELLNAAFYSWDFERTVFVSPIDGSPLYIKETSKNGIAPLVTVRNYLNGAAPEFDLLSLLFRVRTFGGVGNFSILEGGERHNVDLVVTGGETVSTSAGTFETQISEVQSSLLSGMGIREFRINLTADDRKLPVQIRFRTPTGVIRMRLASIQDLSPAPSPSVTITPAPTPVATPTPEPTPRPYQDNMPLTADLPFSLGESLDFIVSKSGTEIAKVRLAASERRLFEDKDSLHLTARVLSTAQGNDLFSSSDLAEAWVDPDTLVPSISSLRLEGPLSEYSRTVKLNQTEGTAMVGPAPPVQIPVGTHSLLSLAYAVRAFSFRIDPDPNNPANDTRVSIFAGSEPLVVTMRPTGREEIEVAGRKWKSQSLSIRSGVPFIDSRNIRLWISLDSRRLPLRIEFGEYSADLAAIGSQKME